MIWFVRDGCRVSGNGLKRRLDELLAENDPVRRVALSRRLRAEMWDLLGEDDRAKLARRGLEKGLMHGAVRKVK